MNFNLADGTIYKVDTKWITLKCGDFVFYELRGLEQWIKVSPVGKAYS
jgi:hypothetical protein